MLGEKRVRFYESRRAEGKGAPGTVLAIGLSVLYHRTTRSMAVSVFSVYGLVAVAIAGAKSALGGQ